MLKVKVPMVDSDLAKVVAAERLSATIGRVCVVIGALGMTSAEKVLSKNFLGWAVYTAAVSAYTLLMMAEEEKCRVELWRSAIDGSTVEKIKEVIPETKES